MSEIPAGLDHYEFRRELVTDRAIARTWHLASVLDSDEKPVMTPDNGPDTKAWDWSGFFPRQAQGALGELSAPAPLVELEIGAGKGTFLVEYAKLRPDIDIVGIEIEARYAKQAGDRVARAKLENAACLRGDAFFFLRDYVPSDSVSGFHMYHPDPWPKDRHRRRRLLKPEFLAEIFRAARPGNETLFHWSTDFQEYDERAQEMFVETPFLEVVQRDAPPTWGVMTNFEKKYRREGRPIYRTVVRILK